MKLITLCLLAVWLVACDNPTPQLDERLLAVLAAQPLIVDVRTPEEFATGHYPGAINIPHDNIVDGIRELSVADNDPIVLYCRTGNRSGQAEQALAAEGFSAAVNAGGLAALLAADEAP
ncbi:rhodanese-like domain-containing protein [bacterium]|nr:rhodanese-like domain-containing protein [bacterium]